jgi:hypothetical protein
VVQGIHRPRRAVSAVQRGGHGPLLRWMRCSRPSRQPLKTT